MKNLFYMAAVFGLSLAFSDLSRAAPLNDGQIAKIMRTANEGEIEAAKVAQKNGQGPTIKTFANTMVDQHGKNLEELKDVTHKAKLDYKSSSDASALQTDADKQIAEIKKLKGSEFDHAYAKLQVSMHEGLLKDLDTKLIPSAKSNELKGYLQETRTHVQMHLEDAKKL